MQRHWVASALSGNKTITKHCSQNLTNCDAKLVTSGVRITDHFNITALRQLDHLLGQWKGHQAGELSPNAASYTHGTVWHNNRLNISNNGLSAQTEWYLAPRYKFMANTGMNSKCAE